MLRIPARAALALLVTFSALAQNHPEPTRVGEIKVFCFGCPGTNSAGEPNDGQDLWPYDVPVADHIGRYVDSSATSSVQHLGMRTIRAGRVLPVPSRNRVYMKMNTTLGVYPLDTFFTGRLPEPMIPVDTIDTGSVYGGRSPFEKLARPDAFVYPEAQSSGWQTNPLDVLEHLADFDADDRGFVYYASKFWGWGIHQDDGRTDTTHLPFVAQVQDAAAEGKSLFGFKAGSTYYVLASDASSGRLYDVTTPSAPVFLGTRAAVARWSKNDALGHVAVQLAGGALRVYTYAALVADAAPLTELVPAAGRNFNAFSYDDSGQNLWVLDAHNNSGMTLWQLPAATYAVTVRPFDSFSSFRGAVLHAGAGHIAITGHDRSSNDSPWFRDLRLLKVENGMPVEVGTKSYFRNHYHAAPSSFAQPVFTNNTVYPHLLSQDGLTYLFYSAHGLGDVYEIGATLRPANLKIYSLSLLTDAPSGGRTVHIEGRNFTPDMVVAFGGTPASSFTFLDSGDVKVTAPPHPAGVVRVTLSTSDQTAVGPEFTFFMGDATNFSATRTWITWTAAQNATRYEVFRRKADGTFASFTTTIRTGIGVHGHDPDSVYFYYVRALDAAGTPSADSNIDWTLTTAPIPSHEIVPGLPVKASHLAALRRDANVLRAAGGLPPAAWTESPIIHAVQIEELRTAANEARTALGFPPFPFTDPALTGLLVKARHFNELVWATQ